MKRLLVFIFLVSSLYAFEDVSFSARSLGLGGDYASLKDDGFSSIANPSLPARTKRTELSLSLAPYFGERLYWSASYIQPVTKLGSVGGTLFFYNIPGTNDSGSGDADARFFAAFPLGRYFNIGGSLGTHSTWRDTTMPGIEPFSERFSEGPFFSLGASFSSVKGLTLGLAGDEIWFGTPASPLLHASAAWEPKFKRTSVISSALLASDFALRLPDNSFKIRAGCELFLLKDHVGFRLGGLYSPGDSLPFSPTFGLTLRTHRMEKTDFELHYGAALNHMAGDSTRMLHELSLRVLIGDARNDEKDSILADQTERARRLREEALARERDRLRSELETIKAERATLERERKDIERIRREKLDAVGRMRGIEITENEKAIVITLTEEALKFDSLSADIPFPQGYKVLTNIASILSNYPGRKILIEVHTDDTPIPEEAKDKFRDSRALTTARAEIIKRYLVEVEALPSANITAKGLGDTKPLADNANPDERGKNRRVEISIPK